MSADTAPAATAIEPIRVLVLDTNEQTILLGVLDELDLTPSEEVLHDKLAHGDTYLNEIDEITRLTLRKRRLETEVKRANTRIAELEPIIVEQWAERGSSGEKHDATGASLRRTETLWCKLAVDTDGLARDEANMVRAQAKAEAGAALESMSDFAGFVSLGFNMNTLSAHFREAYKEHIAAQKDLPEHERRPVDLAALMPDELRPYLVLDATPHVEVRA